jgi:hypothetical protein
MHVQMLEDPSAETFSKQLLNIGDGKVTTDEIGYILLSTDFLAIIDSQDALRYFSMYKDNTHIMSGWQKEQF